MAFRASLFALLALAACHSRAPAPSTPTAEFSPRVDHPYFPLAPGLVRTYVGSQGGQLRRERVMTEAARRTIDGVACVPVVEEIELDDALVELTTEWFAQDRAGNVWKFGEETLVPDGPGYVVAERWLAGVGGAKAWIVFPARMHVGMQFANAPPLRRDEFTVRSLSATAAVAAGSFTDCAELEENPDDPDDRDIILYAPGMGRVLEVHGEGKVELESVRRE